jgi:hypothetical protein
LACNYHQHGSGEPCPYTKDWWKTRYWRLGTCALSIARNPCQAYTWGSTYCLLVEARSQRVWSVNTTFERQ